jgi:hypothetical protein
MEEYEYGPSRLWRAAFWCEHANATPTEVKIFHLSDGEELRRTRDCLRIAERRVPRQFVYLWEMDDVLVVE